MNRRRVLEIIRDELRVELRKRKIYEAIIKKYDLNEEKLSVELKKNIYSSVDKIYESIKSGKLNSPKMINEELAVGLFTVLFGVLVVRMAVYFLDSVIQKGLKYFMGKSYYKDDIKDLLTKMSKNKNFVNDMAMAIKAGNGNVDNAVAQQIVKTAYVQNEINKKVDSNSELDKGEIENEIKTILQKSWNDSGIMNTVINKTKKHIK